MDQEYDVVVLGTGLKECVLSGLMSVNGKKVLHVDRNSYYGGESASLNLEQLFEKFAPGQTPPASMGRTRDYCVDLCPKFLMACGNLVKVLLHTKVTRYLEFQVVGGSFVYKDGKIHKVPATPAEALSSSLMGMFQKRKFKNYLQFATSFDPKNSKTTDGLDENKATNREVFDKFGLDINTQQFTGHAIALHLNDKYLDEPVKATFDAIKLYAHSVSRYGSSPYIYPAYGLGGLPEGFSRLCAIHGGTYMLNTPIEGLVYDEKGQVCGVKGADGQIAKTKQVICDPSYVLGSDFIEKKGQIVRCIAFLSHPIAETNNAPSCQIIIPAHQIKGRKSDIYISVVSSHHKVVPAGSFVAVISADLEGENEQETLAPALRLLGQIEQQFTWVSDRYEPVKGGKQGKESQVFVTSSYDATSHFESATDEVLELYEQIMGSPIDLSISAEPDDLQEQ